MIAEFSDLCACWRKPVHDNMACMSYPHRLDRPPGWVSRESLMDKGRHAHLCRPASYRVARPLLEERFPNLVHEAQACELTEHGPVTRLMGVSEAQHFCFTATDPAG